MLDNLDERRARGHRVLREMFGDKWQQAYAAGIAGTGFGAEAGRMALEAATFILKECGLKVETAKDRGNL